MFHQLNPDLSPNAKRWLTLVLVLGQALTIQLITLARGFVTINVDGHLRALIAAGWKQAPYIFGDEPFWLPTQIYLLGVGLMVYDDLHLTPRIITMVFSLILLSLLYLLGKALFNHWVGLITILWIGSLDFFVHLSLTPLSEIPYYVFIVGFLYFFLRWYDNDRAIDLLLATFLLAVATSIRYEGWITAFGFGVYLSYLWLRKVWKTRMLNISWLVALALLAAYPLSWMIWTYARWEDPIFFLRWYTTLPAAEAYLFPNTTIQRFIPLIGIAGLVGFTLTASVRHLLAPYRKGLYIAFGLIGLILFIRFQRGAAPVYLELIINHGLPILFLAVWGIIHNASRLQHKLWLYLLFGGLPLLVMALLQQYVGVAYQPRFVSQYIVLLAPFAAYVVWWSFTLQSNQFTLLQRQLRYSGPTKPSQDERMSAAGNANAIGPLDGKSAFPSSKPLQQVGSPATATTVVAQTDQLQTLNTAPSPHTNRVTKQGGPASIRSTKNINQGLQADNLWLTQSGGMLALIASFSLWLVYLRAVQRQSIFLVGAVWLIGLGFIFVLISPRFRPAAILSYIPLPVLAFLLDDPFKSTVSLVVWSAYVLLMAVFWGVSIWRQKRQISHQFSRPTATQWQLLNTGLGLAIWIWALWTTGYSLPEQGDYLDVGLALRQDFQSGLFEPDDRILIDLSTPRLQYASILALSNHPEQFILDRDPISLNRNVPTQASFMQDGQIVPHQNSVSLKSKPWPNNPLQNQKITQFITDNNIKAVVLYDPSLKDFLESAISFDKILTFDTHTIYYQDH